MNTHILLTGTHRGSPCNRIHSRPFGPAWPAASLHSVRRHEPLRICSLALQPDMSSGIPPRTAISPDSPGVDSLCTARQCNPKEEQLTRRATRRPGPHSPDQAELPAGHWTVSPCEYRLSWTLTVLIWDYPLGETQKTTLGLSSDGSLELESHGSRVGGDVGLLVPSLRDCSRSP